MEHIAIEKINQELAASNRRCAMLMAEVAALNDDVSRWMTICRVMHLDMQDLREETRREINDLRQANEEYLRLRSATPSTQPSNEPTDQYVPLHMTPRAMMDNFVIDPNDYDSDSSDGFAPIAPIDGIEL
mgnify:FL=1|tara:strand:+ start:727 stop:1116 length:390 start_codon:yes stop_codon:yes gene_type:complete